MTKCCICLILILLSAQVNYFNAQDNASYQDGIQFAIKKGFLIPHRAVMHHLLQGHSTGFTIGWIRQTLSGEEWYNTFRQPQHGLKFNYMDIGNKDVLGTSWSLAGNTFIPFWRCNRFAIQGHLALGLNYMTKRFDQTENPKNNAISSHMNSFVLVGKAYEYSFSRLALRLEVEMAHMSNGAAKLPNLGLNVANINLGASYFFNPLNKNAFKMNNSEPNFSPQAYWKLFGAISTKQVFPTGGPNFLMGSASVFWHRHWRRKLAFDVGLDVFQNGSLQRAYPTSSWLQRKQIGIYGGYVLPINKLQFTVGMGCYVKNDFNPDGPLYHRFGTRYHLNDRWVANLTIKSHWGKADYFEYGVFYILGRNEK